MSGLPDFEAQKKMTAMRLSELSVFDEEQRMTIMEMVKDGLLTIDEALAEVKSTKPKSYPVKYLGHSLCVLYQTEPDKHFDDIMKQSYQNLKKAKPQKAVLTVSSVGMKLQNDDNSLHENDIMPTVIHHGTVPSHSKVFGYIVADTKLSLWVTHLFQVAKPKDIPGILDTIKNREEMGGSRLKQHPKSDDDSSSDELIVNAHMLTYLGCADAPDAKGDKSVQAALTQLRENIKNRKTPDGKVMDDSIPAVIVISTDSVKIVDSHAREMLSNVLLASISFQQPLHGKKSELYCFIEVDDRRNANICHVFACNKGEKKQGDRIFDDVSLAITEAEKRGGNPFKPHGEDTSTDISPIFSKHQLPRKQLVAVKAIGNGQFGKVYLAKNVTGGKGGVEGDGVEMVAVKMLRKSALKNDGEEFLREAEVMIQLGVHEMLVHLEGVVLRRRPWLLVLEYCQYGDLSDVLKACKKKKLALKLAENLYIAEQVASGMQFISGNGYVHMDLACRNCLLHHNSRVKIADFGLTHKFDEGKSYFKQRGVMKLSIRWLAIDSYVHKIFSEKSDVWSYAVTMWEVLSRGRQPYYGNKLKEVLAMVKDGARLEQPKTCPDDLWSLLTRCWLNDPLQRPTFIQLQDELREIKKAHHSENPQEVRDIGQLLNKDLTTNIKRLTFRRPSAAKESQAAAKRAGLMGVIEEEEGE